jgi:hypothetical protein
LRLTHIVVEGHKSGAETDTLQLMALREIVDGGVDKPAAKVLLLNPDDSVTSAEIAAIDATVVSNPTSLENLFGADTRRTSTPVPTP